MRALATAIGFLTAVPIGARRDLREGDFGRASVWFPAVGLLVGLLLAAVDWCGRAVWDPTVAAALVIGAAVVVTGGLHIDGLMDTADAFFSRASRERMLEIMRDPRSGALGVAAGVCVLLTKFAAYAHLAGGEHWRVIAAAPALGRLAMVIAVGAFPYARESGTGARIAAEVGMRHVIGALLVGTAIAVGLLSVGGLLMFAMALALAVACGGYARRRLGGLTGDVYGAINEVVEVAVLLVGAVALG
jgi:adenosylcobinamide-GDP ribazoletransferase